MDRFKYLNDFWKNEFIKHTNANEDGDQFDTEIFESDVELKFQDKSICKFKHAFALNSVERKELAVFTELNGYHVFPSNGVTATQTVVTEIISDEWYVGN